MVLVGINMVKFRAIPNSPPNSLWSAFWWAQAEPNPVLFQQSGWQHFARCAVGEPRAPTKTATETNTCFNPYLEGPQVPNGAYSNCLNCHQTASYQHDQKLVADDVFTSHNRFVTCQSSLDQLGNPPSDCTPDPSNSPTVNTNLLWSLADFIGPPPASASNAPHVNTRKNAQK